MQIILWIEYNFFYLKKRKKMYMQIILMSNSLLAALPSPSLSEPGAELFVRQESVNPYKIHVGFKKSYTIAVYIFEKEQ